MKFEDLLLDKSHVGKARRRSEKSKNKTQRPSRTAPRLYDRFIRGPIPLWWVCEARRLGSAATFVGMALWYYSGLNKNSLTFRAGAKDLTLNCISLKTATRGRSALEKASLIKIQRGRGKKHVITIVDSQPNQVASTHLKDEEE